MRTSPEQARPGPANPKWKGGTHTNGDGYLRITAGPLRGVYVHRLVLEAKLGRPLAPDENAHHIDGDRLNDHPDNLEAVHESEHGSITWRQRKRASKRRVLLVSA